MNYQATLASKIEFTGIGVHLGQPVSMVVFPADAGTGIVFSRTDVPFEKSIDLPARADWMISKGLCTVLGNPAGVYVSTVEHLMAALRALNVDNAIVELDGPEVPIMDGSAAGFVEAIDQVGLKTLSAYRSCIRVKKPVRVDMGSSYAEFIPVMKPALR